MLILRAPLAALLGAALLVGCTATNVPSPPVGAGATPTPGSPSGGPTAASTETDLPMSAVPATPIPYCDKGDGAAAAGVVEIRPAGWFDQGDIPAPDGFPTVRGRVYGPEGTAVPPHEGPGHLALYEMTPASDAYFTSRIDLSRAAGAEPTPVTVCGRPTQVWTTPSTGELVLGWTDRDKSEVLVGNTADFTIEQLVNSAESVSDCCG